MKINTYQIGNPLRAMVLDCVLIKTKKRITFEIRYQHKKITNQKEDGIISWRATNGYEIISEHRMDIQSRRILLRGAADDEPAQRSGTLALPTQKMCDDTYPEFLDALEEWAITKNHTVRITTIA